ncbi:MAG: DUF86 domain-containing protein [Promethearchaeota archaeon]
MAIDTIVLKLRLDKILELLPHLKEIQKKGKKAYTESRILQLATERQLQIAAQAVVDIATHIIAHKNWGAPESYTEAITLIATNRVIDTDLAQDLQDLVKLRNLIVHLNLKIDSGLLYQNLTRYVQSLEAFVASMKQFIKQNQKKK